MDTLLLCLNGPMQSWGVQSRFGSRDTGLEPSKSGVIGLLCAALGRSRAEPVDDLNTLRMGVRVDREGRMAQDFHTAADPKKAVVSTRYYLSGAVFLVGLEGSLPLLQTLQSALQHPRWALYLGRKAFVPAEPIYLQDGLQIGQPLENALKNYPLLVNSDRADPADQAEKGTKASKMLRVVIDDPLGETNRADIPISFARREFSTRRVRVGFYPIPQKEAIPCFSPG